MQLLAEGALKLGIHLSPEQLHQFQRYYEEIIAWNRRFNLTRITDYEDVQRKHFLDSLAVSLAWQRTPGSLLDVGSGAGLPGLPLKIVWPEMAVTLLEATGKKAGFIRQASDLLGLSGVTLLAARAETAAHDVTHREQYPQVTARALAPLATLVELTLPFCRVGGLAVFPKQGDLKDEIQTAEYAIQAMGGQLRPPLKIEIDGEGEARWLVIVEKREATPGNYPRRPGIPAKRPLKA